MVTDLALRRFEFDTSAVTPAPGFPAAMFVNDPTGMHLTTVVSGRACASITTVAVPAGRDPGGGGAADGDDEHAVRLAAIKATPAAPNNRLRTAPARFMLSPVIPRAERHVPARSRGRQSLNQQGGSSTRLSIFGVAVTR